MPIIKFEDLRACCQARILTNMTYSICGQGRLSKDFGLKDQLQRASVSVMANIAEGFDCESRIEFTRFLGYARRSAVEIQSLLYVCLDSNYIPIEIFESHHAQAEKTKAFVSALIRSIKAKK